MSIWKIILVILACPVVACALILVLGVVMFFAIGLDLEALKAKERQDEA